MRDQIGYLSPLAVPELTTQRPSILPPRTRLDVLRALRPKAKAAFALWLAAGSCIAALLVLTAMWLGPTNRRSLTRSFPIEEVPIRLEVWTRIHTVRVTLAAGAVVLGIIASSSRRGAVRHR